MRRPWEQVRSSTTSLRNCKRLGVGLDERVELQQTWGQFALTCRLFSTDFWKMLTKGVQGWGRKRQTGDSFPSGAGLEEGSSRRCRKGTRPHLNPTPWGTKGSSLWGGAADPTEHKRKPAKGQEKGPNTNPPSRGGEVNRARSRSYTNTIEGLAHKSCTKDTGRVWLPQGRRIASVRKTQTKHAGT